MDLHPVENQPFPPDAAPMVIEGTRHGGESVQSSTKVLTPPRGYAYRSDNRDGNGRFFLIQRMPSSQWRCFLKSNQDGTVSWRDFGDTDEDYLRAWEWGSEWVGS